MTRISLLYNLRVMKLQSLRKPLIFVAVMILFAFLCPLILLAGPTGGQVVGGTAVITNPNAATTLINQATNKAIINWNKINIKPNELVKFLQPSGGTASLNRLCGHDISSIMGSLQANGRIFLLSADELNPKGVGGLISHHIVVTGGLIRMDPGLPLSTMPLATISTNIAPEANRLIIKEGRVSLAP